MASKTILFCGGGSTGHVAPSFAVADSLKKKNPDTNIVFICSNRPQDRAVIAHRNFACHAIHAGKFPRGFSIRWITFPLLFPVSLIESFFFLMKTKPRAIFSKGGYVSVPVCLAAIALKIPIVVHESDSVIGLGNGLIRSHANIICRGFPDESGNKKIMHTGNPVRSELFSASKDHGRSLTSFSDQKPVVMIIGGSQGAKSINEFVAKHIDQFLQIANVIHITGKGKSMNISKPGYWTREYIDDGLAHLYAISDVIITRAGAGTLSELSALKKPAIVIPLRGVAHDHQYSNAKILEDHGAIILIDQKNMEQKLFPTMESMISGNVDTKQLGEKLHTFFPQDAADRIANALHQYL